jgi:hypothetical protein
MPILTDPQQIAAFRVRVIIHAMDAYLKSNGRMLLTRTATPAMMRDAAGRLTGKVYPRSRQGLIAAREDLAALIEID